MRKITFGHLTLLLVSAVLWTGCTYTPAPFTKEERKIIGSDPEAGAMPLVVVDEPGAEVLRMTAKDLTEDELLSSSFFVLKQRMIATAMQSQGVGLAAPQVGLARRVIAVQRFDQAGEPFRLYPNVYIVKSSEERQPSIEGCLSIPDQRVIRWRSQWVKIAYVDEQTGHPRQDSVSGYTAIIFQHEIDHLDGLLCTDVGKLYVEDTPQEKALRDAGLVEIGELIPSIKVDPAYAREDNFAGKVLYQGITKIFLADTAARALRDAEQALTAMRPGYSLLVYDGVRPVSVQKFMWDVVKGTPQSEFVCTPGNSLHNYGVAVDLTVLDQTGTPLDMGAGFDEFSDRARIDIEARLLEDGVLTREQIENRALLRKVMTEEGFMTIPNEWWHFQICPIEKARENLVRVE